MPWAKGLNEPRISWAKKAEIDKSNAEKLTG
jgi:hypothetical protein